VTEDDSRAGSGPDEVVQELYGLAPDEFVAARNALAGRLREAGAREDAEEVKKLRKPSTPAWAVNQLVRRSRPRVDRLVEISEALRRAQERALAGEEPANLRDLTGARREIVAALTDDAEGLLGEAALPRSRSQLERVTNTLLALTTDEDGAARLVSGRLTQDEAPTGFGAAFEAMPLPPTTAAAEERRARADAKRRAEDLRRRAAAEERNATRLEAEALRAEEAALRARAEAGAARVSAERARAEAEDAESPGGP
jgi:hypothetical protein